MKKMRAKIWNGYECVMAFIMLALDSIKRIFIVAFPVGGAILGFFFIVGFAGGCDHSSISVFIANVFKTVIAYIVLMLLRYYLKSKEEQ